MPNPLELVTNPKPAECLTLAGPGVGSGVRAEPGLLALQGPLSEGPGRFRADGLAGAAPGLARRPRRTADRGGPWSLVAPLQSADLSDTESGLARAVQLLDRYGVVTREAARAEGQPGGFAGVYPVLEVLEERG